MVFTPSFEPGSIVRNADLIAEFKCSNMAGMRRSHQTNTLVIVSDKTKNLYEDRWDHEILHYTGMGKIGDQSIKQAQNRTLAESKTNGVEVFLFEVYKPGEYFYWGPVDLAANPYQEVQKDEDGKLRKVWMFPVKPRVESLAIPEELILSNAKRKERTAKSLSTKDLKERAEMGGSGAPSARIVSTSTFLRSANVSEYAKRRAQGICTLCEKPAPFSKGNGNPFLETHHIDWLAEGGADTIENTVALCPNCHRKMHVLKLKVDIKKLREQVLIQETQFPKE